MRGRRIIALLSLAAGACAFELPEPKIAEVPGDDDDNSGTSSGHPATPRDGGTTTPGAEAGIDAGASPLAPIDHASALLWTDFETGDLKTLFPKPTDEPGASYTTSLDRAAPGSGKTSILVVTPSVQVSTLRDTKRYRDFDFTTLKSKIRIEQSIWIDQRSGTEGGFAVFGTVFLDVPGTTSMATRLNFNADGSTRLSEAVKPTGADPYYNGTNVVIPSKQWVRVQRELDLTVPQETVVVTREDGQPVPVVVFPLEKHFAPTDHIQFIFGFEYISGPTQPYRVYIDDVLLDAR